MVIFHSLSYVYQRDPTGIPKNRILRNARPTRRLPVGMIPAKNVQHREDSHQKNREKRDQMDEHVVFNVFYPSNIYIYRCIIQREIHCGFLGKLKWKGTMSPKGINWEYCLWRTHDSISKHVPNSKIKDAQQLYATHCKMIIGATKPYVRPIESI